MVLATLKTVWLLLLKETQTVVTLATAFSILHLRNLHSVYLGAGATLAALTAKVLKRFIRQPRPEGALKKSYGMPSTHSSSIAFFGVYLSLCIAYIKPHPRFLPNLLSRREDSQDFSFPVRVALTAAVLYGTYSVCWSRIRLTYHTKAQVVAGAGVGGTLAILALWVWQNYLAGYAPLVETTVEDLLLVAMDSWHAGSIEPLKTNVEALYHEYRDGL